MKKQTPLLSTLALSIGLSLSAPPSAAVSSSTQVPGQGALPNLVPMLEKVLPAMANVRVEGTASPTLSMPEELEEYSGDNAPQEQAQPFEGLSSDVIVDTAKGHVLTNNHIINQTQEVSVRLNDGCKFDTKLVSGDEQSDIVLLQSIRPANLTQITIADSDKLRVGDFAIAVGNPFGLGQTATSDIISALDRSSPNLERLGSFIQTDASISRDNPGGALLNLNGKLIEIDTVILALGGGSIGIGFAIPNNIAKTLVNQLTQFGEIKRDLLGIKGTETGADIAKAMNLDVQRGAFVSEVLPNSGSAEAGIKSGDVTVGLDGKPLSNFVELRSCIATTEPGTKVKFDLLHDGKPVDIKVTPDKSTSSTASAELIISAL